MKISKNFLLKVFLVYSAIAWGICIFGIFIPAQSAFALLGHIGGVEPDLLKSNPVYAYWLRMAASVFSFLGILFLLPVFWYEKYKSLVLPLGIFLIIEGIILMIHGLMLQIPVSPLWSDVGVCLVGGIGIIFCLEKK